MNSIVNEFGIIIKCISNCDILILISETGSGKTCYLPYLLITKNFFNKILISETKRISAISASNYVNKLAESTNMSGYKVRFENNINNQTKIHYMTDGTIVNEILSKNFQLEFDCIIIDEFHERTLNTDLLISLIRQIIISKKKIKIIFLSATLNSNVISNYFKKDIIKLKIPGRKFRIEIFYSKEPQSNYILAIISLISEIHFTKSVNENILVFLPGLYEIYRVKNTLNEIFYRFSEKIYILILHSLLPIKNQIKIISQDLSQKRKIVLSTNLSETSITIKGIYYVIDSGLSKQKITNFKCGFEFLKTLPISKSEAKQRSGRSGRDYNGICYRIYTYFSYKNLKSFSKPEIQKTNLSNFILKILKLGEFFFKKLDLISYPAKKILIRSIEILYIMNAISKRIKITLFGYIMIQFPLDIKLSKIIIETFKSNNIRLKDKILSCISFLALGYYPFEYSNLLSRKNKSTSYIKDDFSFLYNLYNLFSDEILIQQNHLDFFNFVKRIKSQLNEITNRNIEKFRFNVKKDFKIINYNKDLVFYICSGTFLNLARFNRENYKYIEILSELIVEIHPSSLVNTNYTKFCTYYELWISKKNYIKFCSSIDIKWVLYHGRKLFS
ncbi:putative ATP-dependent RNA helicase CDC28 [Guillardia theta]|uniref:ATP-dependent RNA helicase CDC28 n=1 Tax=Guillardia theta TaxID=55529 RepID=Q9AW84_GUITH|nr:putative ATP-dependent RNA helicase CDC28 [Guillardia theta]CAC26985.1 putative ATP-dependent RNA helicase CDC28 [Guillardia theta]|mmetsp:Transcript_39723/g.124780  ORF Transcript_39723/g.124780 Transcript_39723/m.124780 type:complete len:616 (-) Transcript_39723:1081-2928(-)